MGRLAEDLEKFGIKSEGWRETAQKAARWLRGVEDGAEAYMRKGHDVKKSAAEERYATAVTSTRTVNTKAPTGGRGRGVGRGVADWAWPSSS